MTQPEGKLPNPGPEIPADAALATLVSLPPSPLRDVPPVPAGSEACRNYPFLPADRYAGFVTLGMEAVAEGVYSAQELAIQLRHAAPKLPIPNENLRQVATSILMHPRVSWLKAAGPNSQLCYVNPPEPEAAASSIFARVEQLIDEVEIRNADTGAALSLKSCWNIARSSGLILEGEEEKFRYLFKYHPRTEPHQNNKAVHIVEPSVGVPATVGEALDRLLARPSAQLANGLMMNALRYRAFNGLVSSPETATALHRAVLADSRMTRRKVGTRTLFALKGGPEVDQHDPAVAQEGSDRNPTAPNQEHTRRRNVASEVRSDELRALGSAVLERLLDGMVITLHADHIVHTAETLSGTALTPKERTYLFGTVLASRLIDAYPRGKDQRTIFVPKNQPAPVHGDNGRRINLASLVSPAASQVREINALFDE